MSFAPREIQIKTALTPFHPSQNDHDQDKKEGGKCWQDCEKKSKLYSLLVGV